MSDVYIDGEVLSRVRSELGSIRELMERPGQAMRDVSGSVMGAPALARRMDEFGDEWAYGIGELSGFAGDGVEALDRIERAFEDADTSLTEALRDAGEQ